MTSAAPDAAAPLLAVAGRLGDGSTTLPLTAVEIEAEIRGLVATTTVRQTYRNTHAVGIEATFTQDPDAVAAADRVIFPGVGHARSAMDTLVRTGLREAIVAAFRRDIWATSPLRQAWPGAMRPALAARSPRRCTF